MRAKGQGCGRNSKEFEDKLWGQSLRTVCTESNNYTVWLMRTKMEIIWLQKISNSATLSLRQGSEKVFQEILNELKRHKFKELSGFIVATAEWIAEFNDLSITNRTSSKLHNDGRKSAFTKADIICTIVCTHVIQVRSTKWIAQITSKPWKEQEIILIFTRFFLITRISRCDRIWFIIKPLCQELLTEFGSLLDKERVWSRIMALN